MSPAAKLAADIHRATTNPNPMRLPELLYMECASEDWQPAGAMAKTFRAILAHYTERAARYDANSAPFDYYTVPAATAASIRNVFRSLSRLYK